MLYDYATVSPSSVRHAVDEAIERGEALLAAVEAAEERTWGTTMAPLDELAATTVKAYGRGPFLGRAHPARDIRTAGQEAEQKLTAWQSDLVFRRALWEAVEAYAATDEAAGLDGERARLLEHTRRDLRRAGHGLPEADRERLRTLRKRLVEIGIEFSRNLDEYEGGLDFAADELVGLPEEYVEGLAEGESPGTRRVTLDYPDYFPFMDLAEDRDARRRLQYAFYTKAVDENRPLLEEAVGIRQEIADIFDVPSWAHYAMEEKMAREPEAVHAFFDDLIPPLQQKAAEELDDLASRLDGDRPRGWDHRYLHTAIKRDRFGIDPNEVAAYFPLERVVDGMFEITGEVLGLSYRRLDAPTWHPDVQVWAIDDAASGDHLASFYMDLFPREGKFGHAAAFDLVPGHRTSDGYENPVTAILANFTKPTATAPSLLKHDEVVTLFHEFGHVLHNSLGRTELVRFTGFNTEWDFVEAPSQIMEHWCWQPGVLARFARHHDTGDAIPPDLVDQLVAARDLHQGLFWLRQLSFGMLDMRLHGPGDKDLDRINRETSELSGFPFHEGTFYPAGFGHLFGYDAGYYGYLWSKVFGDDMFSRFADEGILSPDVGAAYRRHVLEPGGSLDAEELLRRFLGREPNEEAFLRQLGLQ
ncbi:MAG: M3 family metallopeptidase [Acidimicrobiia bacterium]|nr:M3 family metallopeptidase [Acidimicrobiia bacterium]